MGDNTEETCNFHEMELDDRILKAIAKLGWQKPTLVQEKAIPMLIEGKDVLMRARTGSGKTAAFSVPVIQTVLNCKNVSISQETLALILAPSRELCNQIHKVMTDLTIKCSREVNCIDISGQAELSTQKPLLMERPDVIVSTPTKALLHLKAGNLNLKNSLKLLVVDEADLVFSFGYENEVKQLLTQRQQTQLSKIHYQDISIEDACQRGLRSASEDNGLSGVDLTLFCWATFNGERYLPKIYQAVLASATLSEDVKSLKSLMLKNPVTLKLEEGDLAPSSQLTHYHLAAEELEKVTILCALLKLHLLRGKTIIFVSTVDRCYKVKLFLEQFGIPICVLNSELPAKVRCHAVSQFNQGLYDVIIASDELALEQPEKNTKRKKDKESGVSRGIDFQCVSNVINLDFPLDEDSYIHRAGRTARGNNSGSVLSFVSVRERPLFQKVEEHLKACGHGQPNQKAIKTYHFKIEEVEAFKYRARDAWKAATRIAVREARLKEIKQEIFNCQKLKSYFEDNPNDLQVLRHDKALHTVKKQAHLSDVPDYIVPPALKNISGISEKKTKKRKGNFTPQNTAQNKYKRKMNNPLVAMEFGGFKKAKKK